MRKSRLFAVITLATVAAYSLPSRAAEKSAFATADETPTKVVHAGTCDVKLVDGHACCAESQKVLGVLQQLVAAYTQGDLKTYEKYLDEECNFFDENNHKLISGKADCLEHLKNNFALHAAGGAEPLKGFTIDQPFAKVTNDTCVVTFTATKEIGGVHPHKEQAHITDVFVKRGNEWKKLHWSGKWETVQAS